jgi:hypothetical protein
MPTGSLLRQDAATDAVELLRPHVGNRKSIHAQCKFIPLKD